jgi:hypothetical protein
MISSSRTLPLLGIGVSLLILYAALTPLIPSFGQCSTSTWRYNRSSNPDVLGSSLVPYTVRILVVERAVQVYWVLVVLVTRQWWLLAYFTLWYPALLFVEWLKMQTFDRACGSLSNPAAGNGLSGHFFYFAWAFSTLHLIPQLPTPRTATAILMASLFGWQGFLTWHYGYHSLRQCCLGATLGFMWAALSWEIVYRIRASVSSTSSS